MDVVAGVEVLEGRVPEVAVGDPGRSTTVGTSHTER